MQTTLSGWQRTCREAPTEKTHLDESRDELIQTRAPGIKHVDGWRSGGSKSDDGARWRKLVRRHIQFKKLQKDTVTYFNRSRPSFSNEIEFLKSVQEKKQLQDRNISKTAKWRKSGAPLTQYVYQLWLRLHSPNIVWIPQVAVLSVERGDKSNLISRGAIFTAIRQDPSPFKVVQIIGTIFTCSMLFM